MALKAFTIQEFTRKFLDHQGLEDFTLVFEPFNARRARRAKRSSAKIDASAKDPCTGKRLPNTKTAEDLVEKLYVLAPQMKDWTSGPNRYELHLYDDWDAKVMRTALLGDLRKRAEARAKEGKQRVRKLLERALHTCDRAVGDRSLVTEVAREVLAERAAD